MLTFKYVNWNVTIHFELCLSTLALFLRHTLCKYTQSIQPEHGAFEHFSQVTKKIIVLLNIYSKDWNDFIYYELKRLDFNKGYFTLRIEVSIGWIVSGLKCQWLKRLATFCTSCYNMCSSLFWTFSLNEKAKSQI